MKTMKLLALTMMCSTSAAYAASSAPNEEVGILTYLFLGFFALIVVTQLVPAVILFCGLVKGLFVREEKASVSSN